MAWRELEPPDVIMLILGIPIGLILLLIFAGLLAIVSDLLFW